MQMTRAIDEKSIKIVMDFDVNIEKIVMRLLCITLNFG